MEPSAAPPSSPRVRRRSRTLLRSLVVAVQIAVSVALLFVALRIGDWTKGRLVHRAEAQTLQSPIDSSTPPAPKPPPEMPLRTLGDVPKVASYDLNARLDVQKHVVKGGETITFTNTSSAPLSELYVHLYLNAFEDMKTRFMRKSPNGFRGVQTLARPGSTKVSSFRVREWDAEVWPEAPVTDIDASDRTDIRVPLPKTIAPNETIHFEVAFVSTLPSIVLRTGFDGSFHMVAQWFPKIAKLTPEGHFAHFPFERFSEFYADYGDYDATVDVPSTFTIGAVGERTSSETLDGRRVEHYHASTVGDFAFTAWDGFDEITDTAPSGVEGHVALRCLFPKGFRGVADQQVEAAKLGLRVYGEHYGAYPYPNLTLVHPPPSAGEAGGMEYPTLITTGGPFQLATSGTRSMALLTLHELGHQWFYGIVATNEHTYPFLDEGGATYVTGVAAAELYGAYQLSTLVPGSVAAGERPYALGIHDRQIVSAAADEFETGNDYALLVYYRASAIFHTIDNVFDGAFDRALGAYARKFRFGHPTPSDLFAAIGSEAGPVAEALAEKAITDKGWVDFSAKIDGGQAHIHRAGTLTIPVDVELYYEDGSSETQAWDGASDDFAPAASAEKKLIGACVDPDTRVMIDEEIANNCVNRQSTSTARLRTIALYAGEVFAHLVAP